MDKIIKTLILAAAISFMAAPVVAGVSIDGAKLFNKKCKMCHALNKKKAGPSIKAMSQDEVQLRDVIIKGGKKKMMKAYGKKYSSQQVDAMVDYIRSKQ